MFFFLGWYPISPPKYPWWWPERFKNRVITSMSLGSVLHQFSCPKRDKTFPYYCKNALYLVRVDLNVQTLDILRFQRGVYLTTFPSETLQFAPPPLNWNPEIRAPLGPPKFLVLKESTEFPAPSALKTFYIHIFLHFMLVWLENLGRE